VSGETPLAMKKDEMLGHYRLYHQLLKDARALESQGQFGAAIAKAREAWGHADGMMQCGRKYNDEDYSSLEAVEIVLKHAPLVFDFDSLNQLQGLLKSIRRIEKNTEENLADRLRASQELMRAAHKLWNCLETEPGIRQDQLRRILGGDQDQWRKIAESWERMGAIIREKEGGSYRLYFRTRMEATVPAKCSSCGFSHKAQKSMFLEKQDCPRCRTKSEFVFCQ